MTPLQWLRWRWGTRRSALGTIKHIQSSGLSPRVLVDAGARNSEFMRVVAKCWPRAEVHSFDASPACQPIGIKHCVRLDDNGNGLDKHSFETPSLLKVDCDADTIPVLRGAKLSRFDWVVVEVSEDGNGSPNNRSEIDTLMRMAGFNRSKVVDAVVCIRSNRVAQTDVLYWK